MKTQLLEIQGPDGPAKTQPLEKPVTRIGRADDNDIVLSDLGVSRWHAAVTRQPEGTVTFADLKSVNGSWLHGQRITESVTWQPDDCIALGEFHLTLREQKDQEAFMIQSAAVDLDQLQHHPHLLGASTAKQPDMQSQLHSLELLYEVGRILDAGRSVDDVVKLAVDLLFRIEQVNRAALLLWNQDKQSFEESPIHLREGNQGRTWSGPLDPRALVMSRTILAKVRQENRPLLIRDARADTALLAAASIVRAGIQAAFCSPVFSQGRFLGVLYADNLVYSDAFSDTDFRTFTAIAAQTGLALGNAIANRELIRREVQRQALKAYLPPQVADLILSSDGAANFSGVLQNITVLFADIRKFTQMSENMNAHDVVAMLNQFFTAMSAVIFRFEGTVDKFIGDCIMALFGAPLPAQNSADQALAAAIEMQRCVLQLNAANTRKLRMGIGLHTGSAVVGNVGSADRVQYTAIGDTVNVAARLVSRANPEQILLSEDCRNALSARQILKFVDEAELKGRSQKVRIYEAAWDEAT